MVNLSPIYKPLKNDTRYTSVYGGRASMKSFHVACFMLILTYTVGEVILYTRYTMTSAKGSIIPEFEEKMELMEVAHHFETSGNEIINKTTGSKIIFSGIKAASGNQTARLKSINGLTCWVLDEAEEMVNKTEFDRIDDSIRKLGGSNQVFLIYNTDQVDMEHWIYKHFHEKGDREDTTYIKATYLDNPHLDPSFVAKANAIKEEDPEFYNINYMGEFPALLDSVYTKPHEIFFDDPENADWVAIGGDFGFSDNPAAAVKVWGRQNHIFCKEILYEEGLTNQEIAKRLGEDGKQLVGVWDSSEMKSIQELVNANIPAMPAEKGPGSVSFGIKKLQGLQWHIHTDSQNLLNERKRYRWKKLANGEYARDSKNNRIPVKKDDHLLDAIRYVASFMWGWNVGEDE